MPPNDFYNFDEGAAKAFLELFSSARAGTRLEEFRRELTPTAARTRGARRDAESLVGVWQWFVEHAGDGGGELPPWYELDPPELAAERLLPEVLHDADGLALYLARASTSASPAPTRTSRSAAR